MTKDLPKTIGVLAGDGTLPFTLVESCQRAGIGVFIIAFKGITPKDLVADRPHVWVGLGQVGKMLKSLKAENIEDLVLAGSVKRPSLSEVMPDLKGAQVMARIGLNKGGDDHVLSSIRRILEEEGFRVRGVHEFADDAVVQEGSVGRFSSDKTFESDITLGVSVVQALGALDVGQAAIVQEGVVLGVEAAEGTDALIMRCKGLHRKGRGGVLVKLCKPQQDEDLDMPTIGPVTVQNAIDCGLSGIVVHAGKSLLLERERVEKLADAHKIFVIGIHPERYL